MHAPMSVHTKRRSLSKETAETGKKKRESKLLAKFPEVCSIGASLSGKDLHVTANRYKVASQAQGPLAIVVIRSEKARCLPCFSDPNKAIRNHLFDFGMSC